jgi:hypothetical protein
MIAVNKTRAVMNTTPKTVPIVMPTEPPPEPATHVDQNKYTNNMQ